MNDINRALLERLTKKARIGHASSDFRATSAFLFLIRVGKRLIAAIIHYFRALVRLLAALTLTQGRELHLVDVFTS